MLKEKNYCDYETCVALKELGIGWENVPEKWAKRYFFTRITLYDAQKWLREAHNLHIEITYSPACWTGKIYDLKKWDYIKGFTFFESFEDTLHILIKETVKILKEK
jgi:hypothetical protein